MNPAANSVSFTINGKKYTVPNDLPPTTPLVKFIRQHANLPGTKFFCLEGGCGSCLVNVTTINPATGVSDVFAVNSCLLLVYACDGREIRTIEGIGNKKDGLHPVQQRLADFNGSQCGYCSPGMAMNMYSLLQTKPSPMVEDVEYILDGNICRCTGYRPILDAFKSFASDAPNELKEKLIDIEDVLKEGVCPKTMRPCDGKLGDQSCTPSTCSIEPLTLSAALHLDLPEGKWFRPASLAALLELIPKFAYQDIRYIVGNTGRGVYRDVELGDIYIDLNLVPELFVVSTTNGLSIGAGVSITKTIGLLEEVSQQQASYKYAVAMAKHLRRVASLPVRNAGSLGGNLMLKHTHNEFASDIFTIFEAVGATMVIVGRGGSVKLPQNAFLHEDMSQRIILSIHLPPLSPNVKIRTFKVAPRLQNAHAYVNAAFVADIQEPDAVVTGKPRIVFGGIQLKNGYSQVHATETEEFLTGKKFSNESVVQEALKLLASEFVKSETPGESSFEYRLKLAQGLFYKFVLGVLGNRIPEKLRSGASDLQRGLSRGQQQITTDPAAYPVSKPIPKIEAWNQTSGEAEYVNDIPLIPGELHAFFVGSTIGNGKIKTINPQKALRAPGVVAFYSAKDIPGVNNFIPLELSGAEEVFASSKIAFHSQPVGIIVAESHELAIAAAKLVEVEYTDVQKPVLDIKDEIPDDMETHVVGQQGRMFEHEVPEVIAADVTADALEKASQIITGEVEFGSQVHFHLETQVCVSRPTEDGVDVFCPTQHVSSLQYAIAAVSGIPDSTVNVVVRRCGGAFGGKFFLANQTAAACTMASVKLKRPVRMVLDMETNLSMTGKRTPYVVKYEVGIDNDGKLQAVKATLYANSGSTTSNEPLVILASNMVQNCYYSPSWTNTPVSVLTNTPPNTWVRAPSTTEGIAIIEHIMENIAVHLKKEPLEVRRVNFLQEGQLDIFGRPAGPNELPQMLEALEKSADISKRKQAVENFNQANLWKKRGLSVLPMRWPLGFSPFFKFAVALSVYWEDGSIAISHGGCEMGQGLNTKVAQVAAKTLGVPMEKIIIKPTDSFSNANSGITANSVGSDMCCHGVLKACEELLSRMKPVKGEDELTWEQWVKKAFGAGVDLRARYYVYGDDRGNLQPYIVWGLVCTEVEVDLLTGEKQVLRADILEDVGVSLSPEIDVGQIEGAFVMGLGYWLQEEVKYDPDTGENLTNRSWNYKPPMSKDIPMDFRVSFRQTVSNPTGVLRSKTTGEPAVCLSVSALFAVRHAIDAARLEKALEGWWQLSSPATNEKIRLSVPFTAEDFKLTTTTAPGYLSGCTTS